MMDLLTEGRVELHHPREELSMLQNAAERGIGRRSSYTSKCVAPKLSQVLLHLLLLISIGYSRIFSFAFKDQRAILGLVFNFKIGSHKKNWSQTRPLFLFVEIETAGL